MKIFARRLVPGALLAVLAAPAAAQNVDEIEKRFPDCAGMFGTEHIEALRKAPEDPREVFERWRRDHFAMVEESRRTICRSRIWRYLRDHAGKASFQKAGAMLAGASPFAPLFDAMAVVGKNLPLVDGLDNYQGETFIAVDPNDPNRLVAGANSFHGDEAACESPAGKTLGTQALFGSTDGGNTWVHRCAPWHPDVTGGVVGAEDWFGSDPSLAWDGSGVAYAAYLLLSQAWIEHPDGSVELDLGSAIVIAKSGDAGNTWVPLGVVANDITQDSPFHDKPILAVDNAAESAHPGRMYVIWDRDRRIKIAYSDDGVKWEVRDVPGATGFNKGGNLAIGHDGTVYAVWNRVYNPDNLGKADPDEIWFSRSVDGGETWEDATRLFDLKRASFQYYYAPAAQDERNVTSFVSIDVDRNPQSAFFNRLYLAYSDVTVPEGSLSDFSHIDVYSVHSVNGGWSVRLRVNDDLDGLTHFFPWLAVDQSDGAVHIAWYDTRNDPEDQAKVQVYYARSVDGGVSFERNQNLLDGGDGFLNQVDYLNANSFERAKLEIEENPNQYGDYMGIAAANRTAFAFWTDTRQFMPDDDLDLFWGKREDVAVASVTHCSPPVWEGGPTATLTSSGISVSWPAPSDWGTNATNGTFTAVLRYNTIACSGQGVEIPLSGLPGSDGPILDAPPPGFDYRYRVRARNNCPGTPLTPMESLSPCSNPVSP